jgi:hypothetical protein
MEEEVVAAAVQELEIRLLILEERVVVVKLGNLLLWEVVAGFEEKLVEVHELELVLVVVEAV